MPGKVNPVIPEVVTQVAAQVIGNDQAITVGGMQGHFELNVFLPLIARNLLQSIKLLANASRLLAEKCVDGIEANRETCERYAELTLSPARPGWTKPFSTTRSTTVRWRGPTSPNAADRTRLCEHPLTKAIRAAQYP